MSLDDGFDGFSGLGDEDVAPLKLEEDGVLYRKRRRKRAEFVNLEMRKIREIRGSARVEGKKERRGKLTDGCDLQVVKQLDWRNRTADQICQND